MTCAIASSVAVKWVISETATPLTHRHRPRYRVAVFDCLYVALAQREGCDLITADKRLVNALQKDFPFVTDLATMP